MYNVFNNYFHLQIMLLIIFKKRNYYQIKHEIYFISGFRGLIKKYGCNIGFPQPMRLV